MKKHYYIRKGSPLDKIIQALPFIALLGCIALAGLMNSWELGLL